MPITAVPIESYRLAVHPTLPSIPLFTLTGFLLAEGKAALRLLALFRAAVGWLPGGTAVVTAVLCAFFTTFTGGSGVTILALGALLFQTLQAERYRERFSLGLLTSSGVARPALSAGAAADLLRHRGLRADSRPLQGRHPPRHPDGRGGRGLGIARGATVRDRWPALRLEGVGAHFVGGEVGDRSCPS